MISLRVKSRTIPSSIFQRLPEASSACHCCKSGMYAGADKLADNDSGTARMMAGAAFSKMPMQYGDIVYVPTEMQCVALHPIPVEPALLVQSDPNWVSGVRVAVIGSSSDSWRPLCTTSCDELWSVPPVQKRSACAGVHALSFVAMQTRQSPTLALLALPQSRCNVGSAGQIA